MQRKDVDCNYNATTKGREGVVNADQIKFIRTVLLSHVRKSGYKVERVNDHHF